MRDTSVEKASGKLGVLLPGMGAVGTTFIAGCMLTRSGKGRPIGSVTQLDTLGSNGKTALIKDCLPLARIEDLVFGGWDLFVENAYESARRARVLSMEHLEEVKKPLEVVQPMPAVFFKEYVRKLQGEHIKTGSTKKALADAVRADIRAFKEQHGLERVVAVWCGSTEIHHEPQGVHNSLSQFEQGLSKSDPAISPSMIYAYACLKERVPYANGAPHLTVEIPALLELAQEARVPVAGKDFKTGQTLMKTVVAPGLRARMLGVHGWFSTNILGNRDGEVLDDPDSFKSKEVSKLGVLESILQPEIHPELYGKIHHKVRIEYYPPRGDEKEGWDNIDIFGWLGYPMQIKVNFLCRDSILAAPIVLDLVLLLDLAQRAGLSGVQEWLSFYFKSPMTDAGRPAINDLFVQAKMLKERLVSFAQAA